MADFDEVIRKLVNEILENEDLEKKDQAHLQKEVEFFETLKIKYQKICGNKQIENKKINIYNTCVRRGKPL